MPGSIFDRSSVTPVPRRAPFGTLAMSVCLHAGALVLFMGWQLTAAPEAPRVNTPLQAYVAPDVAPPEVPAAPRGAAPVTAANPDIAPAVAPDRIGEPDSPPVTGGAPPGPLSLGVGQGPGVPGGMPGVERLAGPPPPPPPVPRGPVPVGGDIQPPLRIAFTPPVYPPLALTTRTEGDVVLEATIDETGRVTNLAVRQSVPLLDRAAIEAVSAWRYQPTRLNGTAVPVVMLVTVRFRLR